MARYVISASPLVKIYLPEFHDVLLENPDLIYDAKTDFSFDIVTGCKAVKIKFNKPVAITGRDDKEIDVLYSWLVGESGHSYNETDIYGIVPFDPGVDLVERSDEISQLENMMSDDPKVAVAAQKKVAQIQRDTAQRLKTMRESVKASSEARILRAAKTVHNNLIRQWQINAENNLGKYPPSISEMLGAHALEKQIKASEAKGAAIKSRMNEMMNRQIV